MGNQDSKKSGTTTRDKREFCKYVIDRLPEKSIDLIYAQILPVAQVFLKREKLWKS